MAGLATPYATILDELRDALPACRRCRANKRRCDTQIPSCANCSKACVECIFYDHVRKNDVSRSYIASLMLELQETHSRHALRSQQQHEHTGIPNCQNGRVGHLSAETALNLSSPKTYPYIGQRSCLAQLGPPLRRLVATPASAANLDSELSIEASMPISQFEHSLSITPEMHRFLLDMYLTHIHTLYPLLDPTRAPFTTSQVLSSGEPTAVATGTMSRPWQEFMLQMIYSIACHCVTDRQQQDRYRQLASQSHIRAMQHIDAATTDTNIETLQAIAILAVHSLFKPQDGNTGQLIGFATRLFIDIERHCQDDQQFLIHQIYLSLYSLENQVATTLDRPILLPEPPESMAFNPYRPHTLLTFLYRTQCRFRTASSHDLQESTKRALYQQVPIHDPVWQHTRHSLSANILAILYETYLFVDPTPHIACQLLSTYASPKYVPTFLTPQWAYKAGMIIVTEILQQSTEVDSNFRAEHAQGYAYCELVLERFSRTWPSAIILQEILQSCLEVKQDRNGTSINTCR